MKTARITANFVDIHYVNEEYHRRHPQLVHLHPDVLELLYILKGNGTYIVDGKSYPVSRGSLIICNPSILHGEAYSVRQKEDTLESCCCVLNNLQLPGLPPNCLTKKTQSPLLTFDQDQDSVEGIMSTLNELSRDLDYYQNVCYFLANSLLNTVYLKLNDGEETLLDTSVQKDSAALNSRRAFARQVTSYLDEHFMEPLTLEDLGEIFHVSHYHLAHLFKLETGLSPMKYVTHRRIGESQNLLMNTDRKIGEISSEVGFEDNCYFTSTFKKYVGLTPTEYRRHFRDHSRS